MPNVMTYEELMQVITKEKVITLSDVEVTAAKLISAQSDFDEDPHYASNKQKQLRDLAKAIADETKKCSGASDNYHNVAVTYARVDMYDCACMILHRGLQSKPTSIDLLSDYIKYGLYCGENQLCEEYFDRLQEIPRHLWNWRAYSFSIDYLLDKLNHLDHTTDFTALKKETLALANDFIKQKEIDQAYFDKSTVYRVFGDKNKEQATLKECLENLKVAPKCALRLANIEFDKGNYATAINCIKRCCNVFHPQPDVNQSYSYLLLALCKTSDLFGTDSLEGFRDNEAAVNELYKDFHTAFESGLSGIYRETADTIIKVITAQTGVEYPYHDHGDQYD